MNESQIDMYRKKYELNKLVADKIMDSVMYYPYCMDVNCAMKIVEKMGFVEIEYVDSDPFASKSENVYRVSFDNVGIEKWDEWFEHRSLPIAICFAALIHKGVDVEEFKELL